MWTNERRWMKRGGLRISCTGSFTVNVPHAYLCGRDESVPYTFVCVCPVWIKRVTKTTTDTRRFIRRSLKLFTCARCTLKSMHACRFAALCLKITIWKSQQVEDFNCNFRVQCLGCCCFFVAVVALLLSIVSIQRFLFFFLILCHWFVVVELFFSAAAPVHNNVRVWTKFGWG